MDMRQVRHLLAVVEHGNVPRAANKHDTRSRRRCRVLVGDSIVWHSTGGPGQAARSD